MRSMRIIVLLLFIIIMINYPSIASDNKGELIAMFNNEDILKCKPSSYDYVMAEEKKIGTGKTLSQKYFDLQTFYAKSLWELLNVDNQLMAIDNMLSNSELRFIALSEPINIYQAHWSFGARYLFLRNNIHIERLSYDDLAILAELKSSIDVDSEKTKAFIMRTLRDVICVYPQMEDNTDAVYEMSGSIAPNNAVVLGLATSPEYVENGLYADPKAEVNKHKILVELVDKTEKMLSSEIQSPVKIFLY